MTETTFPRLRQTVLDTPDVRELAEFYRGLLGLSYRPGDEPPPGGPDDSDWLVLTGAGGGRELAFQQVDELPRATWPSQRVPQQVHLDISVPTKSELDAQHERVLALGATLIDDQRQDDPEEPLRVYADPAGHPFCLYVSTET